MKAALGLMLELVKEATIAPEVSKLHVRFNGISPLISGKNWKLDAASISLRYDGNIAFFDRDDIRHVEVELCDTAPVEWREFGILDLLQALKASNLRRKRSQS